ncbi:aldehyde dehydrogenase family protein [Mycobacterium sp. AT1]|uniref:aldehyde dehydrogenase family protein n=1 Tax=Mycobacterium sp. AT1 TaxID=1961706 RepID=UPI0009AC249D|nr:aldehyde dehydrogenase family protein [Mycobacterium sp. AT1]
MSAPATSKQSFTARDVTTGEAIAEFTRMDADQVAARIVECRVAGLIWQGMGFGRRRDCLMAWAADIVTHSDDFVSLIHRESGKPVDDAYMELVIAVEHIRWAARNAERVLRRRRVIPTVLMANYRAVIDSEPFGVIGIISPWNYPLFAPVAPLASALAAGNGVALKPSEHTTAVGAELVASFARANPSVPQDVLTLITGDGEAGAGLISGGVDKVAFTGSPRTARKILHACADTLTPVVMECGGKDAMIVAADADVEAAADAAAWGGFSNAGQTCVGVERIYVHQAVSERFRKALGRRLRDVRVGTESGATYGPMMLASQAATVAEQVRDAIGHGASAPLGGAERIRDRTGEPIVLVDPDESCAAVQEETFGPMVTVRTVADLEEAVRLANGTNFGLGAAVFSKSDGPRLSAALRCGMVSVNSVIAFVSIPELPFGGVGESGYGRIHGAEGLREFSRTKSISTKFADPPGLNGMLLQRPAFTMFALRAMTRARFRAGRRSQ